MAIRSDLHTDVGGKAVASAGGSELSGVRTNPQFGQQATVLRLRRQKAALEKSLAAVRVIYLRLRWMWFILQTPRAQRRWPL